MTGKFDFNCGALVSIENDGGQHFYSTLTSYSVTNFAKVLCSRSIHHKASNKMEACLISPNESFTLYRLSTSSSHNFPSIKRHLFSLESDATCLRSLLSSISNRSGSLFIRSCNLFSRSSNLYSRSSNLFRRSSNLFSRSCNLFSRSSNLFSRSSNLFSRSSNLFGRSRSLFSRSSNLFSRSSNLFSRSSNLFGRSSNLFSHQIGYSFRLFGCYNDMLRLYNHLFYCSNSPITCAKHLFRSFALHWNFTKAGPERVG